MRGEAEVDSGNLKGSEKKEIEKENPLSVLQSTA